MLIRKSGMKYFATQKLTWNDTNEFKYLYFKWRSRDGSEIIALQMPYSYDARPENEANIVYRVKRIREKTNIGIAIIPFGRGNHGGGPSKKDLINIRKLIEKYKDNVTYGSVDDAFNEVEKVKYHLPEYTGELYLEYHRGVYTTGAWIKRLNRYNEASITDIEKLYSILRLLGEEYPKRIIDSAWFVLMINQFHDNISSSLSWDAYRRTILRHLRVKKLVENMRMKGIAKLAKKFKSGYTYVFNSLPWNRSGYVKIDGKIVYIDNVSGMSLEPIKPSEPSGSIDLENKKKFIVIKNGKLRVVISKITGRIVSLYDLDKNREFLKRPVTIRIYEDYPVPIRRDAQAFDAWEVYHKDGYNKHKFVDLLKPRKINYGSTKYYAYVEVVYIYKQMGRKDSIIKLRYELWRGENFIRIRFYADWHTWHRLMKMLVSPNISSEIAKFEMPFSVIDRLDIRSPRANSYDKAKYEVPGHKWVDISDGKYGLAIITDSKYGYSWENGILGVSLLRSPTFAPKIMMSMAHYMRPGLNSLFNVFRTWVYALYDVFKNSKSLGELGFRFLDVLFRTLHMGVFELSEGQPMDQGKHIATIVLYPHRGDYMEGNVYKIAEEMIHTLIPFEGKNDDSGITKLNIIDVEPDFISITTIKESENRDGIIVRLYNNSEDPVKVKIKPSFNFDDVVIVDIPELNEIDKVNRQDNEIILDLKGNEIVTLLFKNPRLK